MGQTSSKTAIRDGFQKQHKRLVQCAEREKESLRLKAQPMYYLPDGFDRGLFDIKDLGKELARTEQGQDFSDVVQSGDEPGCVGDLMLIQLQGDFLAQLERAFRARHHTSVRAMAHAACRRFGHSDDKGVLTLGGKNYLERILRQTQSDQPK